MDRQHWKGGWRGLCASPPALDHINSTTTSTSSQHKNLQPPSPLPPLSDRYPSSPSLPKVAHIYLEGSVAMAVPHLGCSRDDSVEIAFSAVQETTMLRESTYAVKKGKATTAEEQSGVIQRDFDVLSPAEKKLSPAEIVEHADKVWAKKRKELSNLIALDSIALVGDHGGSPRTVLIADGSFDGSKSKEFVT
eukprot:4572930-Amphidinium_carterae.2